MNRSVNHHHVRILRASSREARGQDRPSVAQRVCIEEGKGCEGSTILSMEAIGGDEVLIL